MITAQQVRKLRKKLDEIEEDILAAIDEAAEVQEQSVIPDLQYTEYVALQFGEWIIQNMNVIANTKEDEMKSTKELYEYFKKSIFKNDYRSSQKVIRSKK